VFQHLVAHFVPPSAVFSGIAGWRE